MFGESLQRAIFAVIELLFFLVLVGVGIYFIYQTPLNDITKAYVESACVNGGFTNEMLDNMINDLQHNGFDPEFISISISPQSASNVSDSTYIKRGNIISIDVEYTKSNLLDTMFKKLGVSNDTNNRCIRYGMSERY